MITNESGYRWVPEADTQVIVDAAPELVRNTIRRAGYLVVDGTLAMSGLYRSMRYPPGHYQPRGIPEEDLLRDAVDPMMSQHVWRCLEAGIEANSIETDKERMSMALRDARTVREIAQTWNHRANDPIGRCLDKYDSDLLKVARGIHSVSVLSGDNPIALSQQAADRYEETVITPFVRTARVSAKFDSRLGLFR